MNKKGMHTHFLKHYPRPCFTKPCKPDSPFVISEIISEICSCVNSIIYHF